MGFVLELRCLIQRLGQWLLFVNYIRICYRGGAGTIGSGSGVWVLYLSYDVSNNSFWDNGFRIYRICYRGGSCNNESGGGVWALVLLDDVSGGNWVNGFCLK